MSRRILVIRGGAIGDFVLTLPTMALLKAQGALLEVMAYRRVLGLVHQRFYAEDTRSIDAAPLAACFNPRAEMAPELADYFRRFDQIVSYIYDPDSLFAASLLKAGARDVVSISPRVGSGRPAAEQLLGPFQESRAGYGSEAWPRVFPSGEDQQQAEKVLAGGLDVMIHPGSGSPAKCWPWERWRVAAGELRARGLRVGFCAGEAEEELQPALKKLAAEGYPLLWNLPLEILAACLQRTRVFLGHDSGIGHLAAAAGTRCLLLFGATDPAVWAPPHPHAHILRVEQGGLSAITVEQVLVRALALVES